MLTNYFYACGLKFSVVDIPSVTALTKSDFMKENNYFPLEKKVHSTRYNKYLRLLKWQKPKA